MPRRGLEHSRSRAGVWGAPENGAEDFAVFQSVGVSAVERTEAVRARLQLNLTFTLNHENREPNAPFFHTALGHFLSAPPVHFFAAIDMKPIKFDAFISYSHMADNKLAPSLQAGLQRLAKRWYQLRAMRVFRDETDLSVTPEGWTDIRAALSQSNYFILLASVAGARSKWVRREVEYWLGQKRLSRLLIVLTDGEIIWDDQKADFNWNRTTALPNVLCGKCSEEPFWVDLRWARNDYELSLRNPDFLKIVSKIAAPIHDLDVNTLISEDHRQHKRTMRLAYSAVTILLFFINYRFCNKRICNHSERYG